MKTNYLFTCCILLVFSSSGILLTEISSIAQNGEKPSSSSSSTADKKNAEPKAREGITQPSEIPSTANTSNNSAPVAPVIPAASNEVRGVKANSDDASPISWLTGGFGLLHLLEIAGMVWAYIKINQLSEKSRDSRSQIRSLTDRLSASEQKQKGQADQLKLIGSEAANARNLTSRMNAIEQASSQQKYSGDAGYASPGYNLPSPEAAKAPIQSEYPFLDAYRQSSDNFKHKYAPKIVSEDADNLQKRRAGDYQEIILGEDRQGNYWLFNDGSTTYLIPSPKLKVNDLNIRTAGGLFTCENYTPGYQHVNIVRPAIVSAQLGSNERWKLEQKGILEFT